MGGFVVAMREVVVGGAGLRKRWYRTSSPFLPTSPKTRGDPDGPLQYRDLLCPEPLPDPGGLRPDAVHQPCEYPDQELHHLQQGDLWIGGGQQPSDHAFPPNRQSEGEATLARSSGSFGFSIRGPL